MTTITNKIEPLDTARLLTTLTTTNNTNNSYNLPSGEEQILTDSLRSQVAPPEAEHPSQVGVTCSGVGNPEGKITTIIDNSIPVNWNYVKLDLFNNATNDELIKGKNKFKLAISVKVDDKQDWQRFRVLLNSPFRNLKRGLDITTYENTHYTHVAECYRLIKEEYPITFVSKAYKANQKIKGQTVEELTAILAQTEEGYSVNLHFKNMSWYWELSPEVSQSQRKQNMIATLGIRRGNKIKNLKAGDLLG